MSTIKINRCVTEYPPNGELIIDMFPPFFLFDLSPIAILTPEGSSSQSRLYQ